MIARHTVAALLLIGLWAISLSAQAVVGKPHCDGPDQWPTSMAFAKLKNAGITNNDKVDFSKTSTVTLATEQRATDLYHQVFYITFVEKTGKTIEVIATSDASREECSVGEVGVYVVSKVIQ